MNIRNYKKVEVETFTATQKVAIKNRAKAQFIGLVPCGWEASPNAWKILYYRVIFNEGFTFVEDNEGNIYDIVSGFMTADEISVRNKGKVAS